MHTALVWASIVVAVVVAAALVVAVFAVQRGGTGASEGPLARWIFSGLLPVVFAAYILLVSFVSLPTLHPRGPLPLVPFVGSVLFSAVAAMAMLETVKRLLPLRGAYNRRQLALWLRERSGGAVAMGQCIRAMDLSAPAGTPRPDGPESRQAEADVDQAVGYQWERVNLRGPGLGGAFNLPAEQFSAQVAAAAERATRDVPRYEQLLLALCMGLPPERLQALYQRPAPDEEGREGVADVQYRIAAAIDQLQIRLAGRWRHYLQATAWWLTGLIALMLALVDRTPAVHSATFVVVTLLFGGFFAWLARDVSAVVERLRR
jgi:hypothetical protein